MSAFAFASAPSSIIPFFLLSSSFLYFASASLPDLFLALWARGSCRSYATRFLLLARQSSSRGLVLLSLRASVVYLNGLALQQLVGETKVRHIRSPCRTINGEEPQSSARDVVKLTVAMRKKLVALLCRSI